MTHRPTNRPTALDVIRGPIFVLTLVISLVCFLLGAAHAAVAQTTDEHLNSLNVAVAAVVTAIAAVIGQITPWVRSYFEDRGKSRELDLRRLQIEDRVQVLESRARRTSRLMGEMWNTIRLDRSWMVQAHLTHPDIELPANFMDRKFDDAIAQELIEAGVELVDSRAAEPADPNGTAARSPAPATETPS